jgi:hypothetical protein
MRVKHETVTVWSVDSRPSRLLWRGIRYRVTDTPTALYDYIVEAPTHPLEPRIGWRFQGTSQTGETHVFDVHQSGRQEWELVAVYD